MSLNQPSCNPPEACSFHEQSPLLGDTKPVDNDTLEATLARNGSYCPTKANEPTTKQILVVMSSICVGSFLSALDSTVIATLSAPISASFNSFQLVSWLVSAYLIATAAAQPLSGRLTDIYSRRAGLLWSNFFFGLGNLICGLASDQWVMILGRVVAGIGGGCLNTIAVFIASDMIPLRRRGIWQGFINVIFGTGAAIGGVFGGWVNDTIGWRWAFLTQVPATVVSAVVVYHTVHIRVEQTEKKTWERVDGLGAVTLVTALVVLLLGLNSGGNVVPWTHPLVLITLPLSAVLFMAFIYIENNSEIEPIIPVKLLLNRTVSSACLTNWFITMVYYGLLFYGPMYFQVKGLSPTTAGARLIPSSVGGGVGSALVGIIMRWAGKYYFLNVGVESIFVASLVMVSQFTLTTPSWVHFVTLFFAGGAYQGTLTVTLLALISAVDHKHQAVITSASYAFRSTGATIGVTITSAIFQNLLKTRLWDTMGDREGAADIIPKIRDSLDAIKDLPPAWKGGVQDAYMDAFHGAFLALLGIAILGATVSLFMREYVLHTNLTRE